MGALRGSHRHHYRHDDAWGVRSTEGLTEGVRLHEGAYCRSRFAAVGTSAVADDDRIWLLAAGSGAVPEGTRVRPNPQTIGNSAPLGPTVRHGCVNFQPV